MSLRICAVIPSRNHHTALAGMVRQLRAAGLGVIIVDDGSDEPARSAIAALHRPDDGVTRLRLEPNEGKGSAVLAGARHASAQGFTHVLQVDADGQHDLSRLADLLERGNAHPNALIVGFPIYDSSVPRVRAIGRRLTTFWVWVETLSLHINDAMLGYRLYPIPPLLRVMAEEPVGRRMDFDIDILVRMAWRGIRIVNIPVRVVYPEGNTSNFHYLRDNWRITKLHTRLVFGMLRRSPLLLRRRGSTHWAQLGERGALLGLRIAAAVYRHLGQRACLALLFPVALYFFLTGREQRRASRDFLARVAAMRPDGRKPRTRDLVRHSFDFARKALETIAAWAGEIDPSRVRLADAEALRHAAESQRGLLLIVSHLGNVDLSRAVLDEETRARLTVLVHTRHAENYNRVLRSFRPDAAMNTIQVSDVTPATAMLLAERIAQGAWIAIAGDRTPVAGAARVSRAAFLGADAPFPQGPYVLAHLLRCPVYTMFCLREGAHWRVYFEKFADEIVLPRGARDAALNRYAQSYAERLEAYCIAAPYQWYNFFDFWAPQIQDSRT